MAQRALVPGVAVWLQLVTPSSAPIYPEGLQGEGCVCVSVGSELTCKLRVLGVGQPLCAREVCRRSRGLSSPDSVNIVISVIGNIGARGEQWVPASAHSLLRLAFFLGKVIRDLTGHN